MGCAVALRVIQVMERDGLLERARQLGEHLLDRLSQDLHACPHVREVRGQGLMAGIELDSAARAAHIVRQALESGWILLGEGADGRVLSLTPPLVISEPVLDAALDRLVELIRA